MGIRLSCVKPALALSRYRIWMNAVGTYGSILGVRMLKPTSGLPVIACTATRLTQEGPDDLAHFVNGCRLQLMLVEAAPRACLARRQSDRRGSRLRGHHGLDSDREFLCRAGASERDHDLEHSPFVHRPVAVRHLPEAQGRDRKLSPVRSGRRERPGAARRCTRGPGRVRRSR